MAKQAIPAAVRLNLLKDLENDKPSLTDLDDWIRLKADQYAVNQADIQTSIAQYTELFELQVRVAASTTAQKVAAVLGVTHAAALRTFQEGLTAVKIKRTVDRNGNVTNTFEDPDWDARRASAREVELVLGGYAPTQMKVEATITDDTDTLTDEQLEIQSRKLAHAILSRTKQLEAPGGAAQEAGSGADSA